MHTKVQGQESTLHLCPYIPSHSLSATHTQTTKERQSHTHSFCHAHTHTAKERQCLTHSLSLPNTHTTKERQSHTHFLCHTHSHSKRAAFTHTHSQRETSYLLVHQSVCPLRHTSYHPNENGGNQMRACRAHHTHTTTAKERTGTERAGSVPEQYSCVPPASGTCPRAQGPPSSP